MLGIINIFSGISITTYKNDIVPSLLLNLCHTWLSININIPPRVSFKIFLDSLQVKIFLGNIAFQIIHIVIILSLLGPSVLITKKA